MSETVYIVPPDSRPARADKVLAAAFPEHSRVAFQRAFDAGLVTRGGSVIGRDTSVQGGDELAFSFPETRPAELKAVEIPLEIVYEDRHLLAINKTSGMVVHPGAATGEDTLVHALLAHCAGQLSGVGGVERPGIVHRLDRETSGLIVVAKNDRAHRGLAEQFSERTLHKEYLALVAGAPALLSGSIRKPIGRHPTHRHRMAIVESGGKDAHTDWEVVEKFGDLAALIRCVIHTGRTHQIRVHLKSLGHVLLGDAVYGWKPDPRLTPPPERVMLHAAHLVVKHPVTGKVLDLRAPLPDDFEALMKRMRKLAAAEAKARGRTAPKPSTRKKPAQPPAHVRED